MAAVTTNREPPWQAGWHGARANLLPGLVLQVTALVIVLAYYNHAPTRAVFDHLTTFRAHTGLLFGIISTGFFGGFLPFLYLRCRSASRHQYSWRQGMVLTVFWSYKGLEVEIWYRLLARVVGAGHDITTIVIKTLMDQAIYCTILAIPLTVLVYQWTATGFRGRVVVKDLLTPGWYSRSVLPTLLANVGVWTPAVAIIYALPTPLQLPLQNLVLMFFTLLLAHLNARQ